MKFIKTLLALGFIGIATSCNNDSQNTANTEQGPVEEQSIAVDFSGNYVTPEYLDRDKGYDWVAVTATKLSDSTLHISIRSRADKKKPTCTFDADANRLSANIFKTTVNGKNILYTFGEKNMTIGTEKKEDVGILNFYCSGGGSLAGTYNKISEPLDSLQMEGVNRK
ncbi:hypothetical protein [Pedobacter frigoris]|uniref:hypothetical protein n=1 Tax=Pedobacter frigoris TaxID=2571272 RepID=UPI00292ED475|nr:hypothetical protein [Pedobacter frigoris]